MSENTNPSIYVACLAAYNSGYLHGAWIDATLDADEIQEAIQKILKKSPIPGAEEWAIHDYQCFGELKLSESHGIAEVARLAGLIQEHGEAFAAFAAHIGQEDANTENFEEAYCGEHESEVEYATELFDELYLHEIPENLHFYIDYEKFSRDLFINDYYSVDCTGGVYVFRNI